MKIINIIKEEIKNIYKINEEYDSNNKLYGYHVTIENSIEKIKNNGFLIGSGAMEGRGFYGFYDFERAAGYSSKEARTNYIIKFEITDINKLLILDMNIAKEIFNKYNYHIVNQFNRIFPNGVEYAYYDHIKVFKHTSFNTQYEYIKELYRIETKDNRAIGPELFTLQSKNFEDNINVINYGTYGLQYRLNDTNLAKPIGFYEMEPTTKNILNYTEW